ncbi:hypothetical protein AB2E30_03045 [Escherichia coli]|nr:hypothetical protein ECAD30_45480 [Escherichia coli AD30]
MGKKGRARIRHDHCYMRIILFREIASLLVIQQYNGQKALA